MMKNYLRTVYATLVCLALAPTGASAAAEGPTMGSASDKLFGSNVSYSATKEVQTGKAKAVVTQVFVDQGKVRQELDMAASLGSQLPPEMVSRMRNSGMAKYILLYLPEKQGFYQIQPATKGYVELPFGKTFGKGRALTPVDYKLETTELGKETFEGQACVKNKAVVTDPQNRKSEFVVWTATGLKNFPMKIQTTTALGEAETTIYRNVKLTKPDAKLFEFPAGYRKYPDMGAMMRDVMMKQLSGGMGM